MSLERGVCPAVYLVTRYVAAHEACLGSLGERGAVETQSFSCVVVQGEFSFHSPGANTFLAVSVLPTDALVLRLLDPKTIFPMELGEPLVAFDFLDR